VTARLRAQRLLQEIGLGRADEAVERAPSLGNEVWVLNDQVLRINPAPGSHRLRTEAALSAALPAGVGHPTVIESGTSRVGEWLLCERVAGEPLSRVWSGLDETRRRRVVHDLAHRLRLIHTTPPPAAVDEAWRESPHVIEPDRLVDLLARARRLPHVDTDVIDGARQLVARWAPFLDDESEWVLVHGDLHFENVLCADGRLTAVLDFEFARRAPRDLDLATLLRFCADPRLHVADDYAGEIRASDYRQVPGWLWEEYPELFAAAHVRERMALYLLAFDLSQLVSTPPKTPTADLPPFHPYHRVRRTVDGRDELARFVL
jgi:aminoglycoside phosphotransferase (APT) family kinase protein